MLRASRLLAAPLLLGTLAALPAAAEPVYNQVSLRAEVSREVVQDRMHVTLFREEQGSDPAKLAAQITQVLNQAVTRARQAQGVEVSFGNRHAYPIYDRDGRRLSGWRERAELRLSGSDFSALSRLTAELLGELQMGSLHFSVSDAIRQQNEDAMLKEAIAAFRARAKLASEALGGSDYRVMSLNLHSSGSGFTPVMRSMAMKAERMDAMAVPEIEPGTQQLTFTADGAIQVQMR